MELTIHNVKAVAKPIVFYWMTKTSQLPCSIDFLILNAYRFGTFILWLMRLHPVSRCHHGSDLERRVTSVGFTTWIFLLKACHQSIPAVYERQGKVVED